jgi:hypothetical protein
VSLGIQDAAIHPDPYIHICLPSHTYRIHTRLLTDDPPAAHASFSNMTGSLTIGKRFDAVVWDDDLLRVAEGEMLEVGVKATIMDGRLVYGQIPVS